MMENERVSVGNWRCLTIIREKQILAETLKRARNHLKLTENENVTQNESAVIFIKLLQ